LLSGRANNVGNVEATLSHQRQNDVYNRRDHGCVDTKVSVSMLNWIGLCSFYVPANTV